MSSLEEPDRFSNIGRKHLGQCIYALLPLYFHAYGKRAWSLKSAGISFPGWRYQPADEYDIQIRCS
jgi:hypothetical protein